MKSPTTRFDSAVALAGAVFTSLAVLLSVFQMIQYWRGIVPIANTTWEQYRALFLRVQ